MNRLASFLSAAIPVTILASLLALAPATAYARTHHGDGNDHVGVGRTIDITDGDATNDIVCAFCTVRVHGDVSGDMVTFFSDVQVDSGHALTGDAVVFGGRLNLADQSSIHGDLVVFGGDLAQAATASIHGDHVLFTGTGWLLLLLTPLLIPIGIIWLIVYLVRRNRYQFPVYPGGRF